MPRRKKVPSQTDGSFQNQRVDFDLSMRPVSVGDVIDAEKNFYEAVDEASKQIESQTTKNNDSIFIGTPNPNDNLESKTVSNNQPPIIVKVTTGETVKVLSGFEEPKEEKKPQEKMDLVYLYRGGLINSEFAYSLRSAIKNMPFFDRIFIAGGLRPRGLNMNKIKYIFTDTINYNVNLFNKKKFNTQNSFKIISENKEISENFILMNDDFYIMKPLTELRNYKMIKNLHDFSKGKQKSWFVSMAETDKYLKSKYKKPSFNNFELHVPMIMNKTNLRQLFKEVPMTVIRKCQIRSLYGNMFLKDEDLIAIPDRKICQGQQNTDIDKNALFYSSVEVAWKGSKLKRVLAGMFPEKSEYEL